MSLRLRMSLAYALVVAIVVAVLGATLYLTMQKTLSDEMDQRLRVRSDEIQFALWPSPDAPTLSDLTPSKLDLSPLAQIDAPGMFVQVLDTSGNVLATSSNQQSTPMPVDRVEFDSAVSGRPAFGDVTLPGDRTLRVLSVPLAVQKQVAAVLQVSQSREPLKDTLAGLQRLLAVIGSSAVILAVAVGWLVSYRGLQPLSLISSQAADIAAKRDFRRRLHMDGRPDEIGTLARTIDGLLANVDETLQAHRDFVADTSHELRNPLLTIRTNVDVIDRIEDPDERREALREVRIQVARMTRLISDLLLLAQVERGLILQHRPVDVSLLIERVAHEARQRAHGQRIHVDHAQSLDIVGDSDRLQQILANLLDNAIKHTPAGGTVSVRTNRSADGVRIDVEDNGEGIAPEHLPHIFERAYRVTSSQTGPHASYGLGLAIVKYLTEAHGGQVEVRSELGHGTCITIVLPAKPLVQPTLLTSALPLLQPALPVTSGAAKAS